MVSLVCFLLFKHGLLSLFKQRLIELSVALKNRFLFQTPMHQLTKLFEVDRFYSLYFGHNFT